MAEKQPTKSDERNGVTTYFWENVTNADTCGALSLNGTGALAGRLQIKGTPDSATVDVQGSEDGSTYGSIKDAQGLTVALTSAGDAVELSSAASHIKPVPSGGGGSQDLDIYLTVRN